MLLKRDWIHANCYIPFTMHQFLIHCKGNQVEIIPADTTVNVAANDHNPWQSEGKMFV
jgi:hypothetical protein